MEKTPRVAVLLAEGFEEIEAVTLIDVLRRAGLAVTTCGLSGLQVKGSHGITVAADTTIDAALAGAWDMVILPGGMPGSTTLRDDARVGKLLEKAAGAGGYVGAICAAPIALARFGHLEGRQATSYPGFAPELGGADYREDRVVCDGRVMTSRGPGTAMEFALAIVERLAGPAKARELKAQMLAP